MAKNMVKAKAVDLGALQSDYEAKRKVANTATKNLERAQDAYDHALQAEGASELALKNALRSVVMK